MLPGANSHSGEKHLHRPHTKPRTQAPITRPHQPNSNVTRLTDTTNKNARNGLE